MYKVVTKSVFPALVKFPNPSFDEVNIKITENEIEWDRFEIFSNSGVRIYSNQVDERKRNVLNVSGKIFDNTGFYIIKLYSTNKISTKRVYIQK